LIDKKEIPNSILVSSLGQRRYLGLLRHADVGFGNSSSLVIEAPMLGTPSVNVGRRQEGRLRSPSIIDVEFNAAAISCALQKSWSPEFKKSLINNTHPFGTPGVAGRIVEILASSPLPKNLVKGFYE
jgi:UDP-N-acetylglucosamine 2-epimerase